MGVLTGSTTFVENSLKIHSRGMKADYYLNALKLRRERHNFSGYLHTRPSSM
ncbi:MAG: hypothetical protein QNJ38_14955 [Prochloraceae cyanobacterium]|nr:hypothetical protein [Prochloraceae cyanobacterium]